MKLGTFVSAAVVLICSQTWAQDFGNQSAVAADLRCEQDGGGVAIQLPTTASKGRVWQTDVGESDGLELTVTDFKLSEKPGNFQFKADLFGSEVRGQVSDYILRYEMFDSEQKTWTLLMGPIQCVKVQ